MSPHDFRRIALAHELLARRPSARPADPVRSGVSGLSPPDSRLPLVPAEPPPARPAAAGMAAEAGRML